MSALARLQAAILCQAAQDEEVAQRLTQNARNFVIAGAVAVLSVIAANPAQAQNRILTPANCAMAGQRVGDLLGQGMAKTNDGRAIGGVLGALAGAAIGNTACSPSQTPRDSSYNNQYGSGANAPSYAVGPQSAKDPLSISERDLLDGLQLAAVDAKREWKRSLWQIDQAHNAGNSAGVQAALELEAQARQEFQQRRMEFVSVVEKLNRGAGGMEPKAVNRYLETSAALTQLRTDTKVSYQSLNVRDMQLQQQSQAYANISNQAAATQTSRPR